MTSPQSETSSNVPTPLSRKSTVPTGLNGIEYNNRTRLRQNLFDPSGIKEETGVPQGPGVTCSQEPHLDIQRSMTSSLSSAPTSNASLTIQSHELQVAPGSPRIPVARRPRRICTANQEGTGYIGSYIITRPASLYEQGLHLEDEQSSPRLKTENEPSTNQISTQSCNDINTPQQPVKHADLTRHAEVSPQESSQSAHRQLSGMSSLGPDIGPSLDKISKGLTVRNQLSFPAVQQISSISPPPGSPGEVTSLAAKGVSAFSIMTQSAKTYTRNANQQEESSVCRGRLIVVLRFGDASVRGGGMRDRVREILAGTHDTQMGGCRPVETSEPKPSKPTHPFFLRKANQKINNSTVPSTNSYDPRRFHSSPVVRADNLGQEESGGGNAMMSAGALTVSNQLLPTSRDSAIERPLPRSMASKAVKRRGSIEVAWPPKGTTHVRGPGDSINSKILDPHRSILRATGPNRPTGQRKGKYPTVHISQGENILDVTTRQVERRVDRDGASACLLPGEFKEAAMHPLRPLRKPLRNAMTRKDLQWLVGNELCTQIAVNAALSGTDKSYTQSRASNETSVHPALTAVWDMICSALTPFDTGTCETQLWAQKYAPKSAAEVLQPRNQAIALRDWLKNLTISTVDSGNLATSSPVKCAPTNARATATKKHKPREKKRHSAEGDLDGFIVSSSSEEESMGPSLIPNSLSGESIALSLGAELSELDSSHSRNGERPSNVAVISGPHGCGKTAAVYAVAKELGYEVFEINAGSRRSGRDVLEKVGDMSKNHLVRSAKEQPTLNKMVQTAPESNTDGELPYGGNQGSSLKSLFPNRQNDKLHQHRNKPNVRNNRRLANESKVEVVHRQSLILLEEVDVLFEDDKQFWSTVLSLATQSKRPVIMTCNDEELVPLNEICVHTIFHFERPNKDVVIDYLLLIAGAEGHLLTRAATTALYMSRLQDLRASIMELDFWCQMAVGDRKGGLEWMDGNQPWMQGKCSDCDTLRVVSQDTYRAGMALLNGDAIVDCRADPDGLEEFLSTETWASWGLDVEDWLTWPGPRNWTVEADTLCEEPGVRAAHCRACDMYFDAISAADVLSGSAFAAGLQVSSSSPVSKYIAKVLGCP